MGLEVELGIGVLVDSGVGVELCICVGYGVLEVGLIIGVGVRSGERGQMN